LIKKLAKRFSSNPRQIQNLLNEFIRFEINDEMGKFGAILKNEISGGALNIDH